MKTNAPSKKQNDEALEKMRVALGSAAIIAAITVATTVATLMGISQMA